MKATFSVVVGCALFIAGSSLSFAKDSHIVPRATRARVDIIGAPIKTADELRAHLASSPSSPLYRLTPGARANFLGSLVFGKQGLGSYSYQELEGLSVTTAYRTLSLFGVQSTLGSIPNLKITGASDRAIVERENLGANSLGETFTPYVDPNKDHVCVVGPDPNPSVCQYRYGSVCTGGCTDI